LGDRYGRGIAKRRKLPGAFGSKNKKAKMATEVAATRKSGGGQAGLLPRHNLGKVNAGKTTETLGCQIAHKPSQRLVKRAKNRQG